MKVDWGALGSVFGVSLVVVLGLVALFSAALRGLSAREVAREGGGSGTTGLSVAVTCFAACAAVVLFGIYLIVAR
ncbi:hypothetical protein KCV87_16000 [Actinosynnema pretiosum subsp. pretiosum]|uniref:Uncharacterized protein n=3 Tax=Actinosynnema TaxID=40566 RepID=C6WMD8_ACTMD|nr:MULTISPECIES: hypothetical protein [Actinosynnema]ACU34872.1 hypothetical protein Amir_0912 [Actinosynnema mirum DSM 43827]ATE52638.1 hypothetical protein CNX65_04515 [Actinosynnema pretiosum]AXX28241.1 putative membrane protein [Actinosynnema pretiosum subsp. pretiosum]QUF07390.1 hypothetical protein KCV87_16000 [Actinosynnema pretiosum subsp. pretiosum]